MTGSRIVNRLLRLPLSVAKGQYLFWLSDSLTPLIGGSGTASGLTASGGYLSGAGGSLTMPSVDTINLGTDSFVMAVRWVNTGDASALISIEGGAAQAGPLIEVGVSAQYKTWYIYDDLGNAVQPATIAGTTPLGGTEYTGLVAYDAVSNKAYRAVDGVMGSAGTAMDLQNASKLINKFALVNNVTLKVRDVHFIKFTGSALPLDIAALVASYHANPLVKLSQWAT